MSHDNFITDAFSQWLSGNLDTETVRAIEQGGSSDALWESIKQSGFADLLVDEAHGGAGQGPETACKVLMTCGEQALPVPLVTTLWVRAALAREGLLIPEGPIALAWGQGSQPLSCRDVAFARSADWVLMDSPSATWLLPTAAAVVEENGIFGSLAQDLTWPSLPAGAIRLATRYNWEAIGAGIYAALIAGAATRILSLSLKYAGERAQFGKALGKFQAIQQQLAVLAEQVFAVRMAAQQAFRGEPLSPALLPAMVAKLRCSEAITSITAIGHLVHGAIGVTEEYSLQLFTRRLHEWRYQFGNEAFWADRLGATMLASEASTLGLLQSIAQSRGEAHV